MRVLLINKYHYLRGGAERSYFDTAELLASHGHEVAFFSMKHPENLPTEWSKYFIDQIDYQNETNLFKKITAVINIFYNFRARKNLEELINEFKPDVAHLHNIYHQLSPSIISVLKKHNIPVIMTLHDYKLICPNYNLYASGQIWEKSKPDKFYQAFLSKAVKNSYLKSFICAVEAYSHKLWGIYGQIDLFISPSNFLIKKFEEFGFKNKIIYLPHALLIKNIKISDGAKGKYILYYGRLSQEKGIGDLIKAFSLLGTGIKLYILGDGPMKKDLGLLVEWLGLLQRVKFISHKTGDELWQIVNGAEFIVMPSRWYENAPYGVLEAMALGKTVICPHLGGLAEIIQNGFNGFLYKNGSIDDLADIMKRLTAKPEIKNQIAINASQSVKAKNNQENFYNKLISIYEQAMAKSRI